MTKEEKVQAILDLIQDDAKAVIIIRFAITRALPSIPEDQLDLILEKLNGTPE